MTTRRYDLGNKAWYPHHPPFFRRANERVMEEVDLGRQDPKNSLVITRRYDLGNRAWYPQREAFHVLTDSRVVKTLPVERELAKKNTR